MKRYLFPLPDGRFLEVKQNKIDSALPYINKRFEALLPTYVVDVDEVKNLVNYIRVNVNRDCTKEEVNGLVGQIRGLLLEALDNMEQYEIVKKGRDATNEVDS